MQLMDDIRRRECRRFAHAWQGWRGGNLVPQRHNVHIEDIANLLHLVSVIEIVSPHEANFRLVGTAPRQLFAISMPLEDVRLEGPTEESDQLPLPEGFQFIDIGAGVPNWGLGLDDRQPAELYQRRAG